MPAPSSPNTVWSRLGYHSARELLAHFPRRYEDRSRWMDPFTCAVDQVVTVQGEVVAAKSARWRGGRHVFEATLQPEGTIESLSLIWFNMPFMKNVLPEGVHVVLHGKVSQGKQGRRMMHPEYEVLKKEDEPNIHLNRITPIYPTVSGVHQKLVRAAIYRQLFYEDWKAPEFYPAPGSFLSRVEAIRAIHFPDTWSIIESARRRLAFDELVVMQSIMGLRRLQVSGFKKSRLNARKPLMAKFLGNLGFAPTRAQERVFQEMDRDLAFPRPMHRLLQGDVGSGKTLVAAYALVRCLETGKNGALLAPTETLAMQHAANLRKLMAPLDIEVVLWTRSARPEHVGGAELHDRPRLFVGTHALIQKKAALDNIGLGVVDEQHKFGVAQRQALMGKGEHPDLLVMTATPIPRTLCLTYYGDLDVSVLDEMPPGRKPVKTVLRSRNQLKKVWSFIKKEASEGKQAYVVYPLVEESEKVEARSVQEAYQDLREVFGEDGVVMLHGKMDAEKKEARMREFREGRAPVMVATSVIEVGVDNPNATVMVIENAERFGLAQLHQLRGRVGRGHDQAYCVLVGEKKNEKAWERLKVMESTEDGFKIAEADLKLRGPGDLLGTDQSGHFRFKIAHLIRDLDLFEPCREVAQGILETDPTLAHHPGLRKRVRPYLKESGIRLAG